MNEFKRDFKGVWIPKEIWLNKDLGWTEKLLLVEIDSLDNEEGCFATNQYFAEFFDLSKDRISKLISGLNKKGYIEVELIYKPNTKQVDKRIIRVNYKLFKKGYLKSDIPIGENNYRGIGENNYRGIGENNEDNNTDNNNTNIYNTIDENINSEKEEKKKSLEKEIFDYWNEKKITVHRKITTSIKSSITKALKDYSIEEIKSAIDSYCIAYNDATYKYCEYKETLSSFLSQRNMLPEWVDDGKKCINYMRFTSNKPNNSVQVPKSPNTEVKKSEVENILAKAMQREIERIRGNK